MGIEPEFCGALGAFDLGGAAAGKPREWWQKNLKWRLETIDDRPIDGAESQRDVWNRLLPFYEKIINRADKNIIIVSHCDTLSVFYTMWLGLDVGTLNKCCLYGTPGGVSVMREDRCGKRIISSMNDLSYINS